MIKLLNPLATMTRQQDIKWNKMKQYNKNTQNATALTAIRPHTFSKYLHFAQDQFCIWKCPVNVHVSADGLFLTLDDDSCPCDRLPLDTPTQSVTSIHQLVCRRGRANLLRHHDTGISHFRSWWATLNYFMNIEGHENHYFVKVFCMRAFFTGFWSQIITQFYT